MTELNLPPLIEVMLKHMADPNETPFVRDNYRNTLDRIANYIGKEIEAYDKSLRTKRK